MKSFTAFLSEHWAEEAYRRNGYDLRKHKTHKKQEKHLIALSDKLHETTAAGLSHEDHKAIRRYTGITSGGSLSTGINNKLLKDKPLGPNQQSAHETILKHAKPSGHEVHLYSGTRVDFSKLAKKAKDGILHSKAHISATHSPTIAKDFASFGDIHNMHIVHIHVKPHDKILHVSKISHSGHEDESIIPAGTKLKYHGSTEHTDTVPVYKITEHHFTIHHQD